MTRNTASRGGLTETTKSSLKTVSMTTDTLNTQTINGGN